MSARRDGEWWLGGALRYRTEPEAAPGPARLAPARAVLASLGASHGALGVLCGALLVVHFDRPLANVVGGSALGLILFGLIVFATETRRMTPDGELAAAPADVVVERDRLISPSGLIRLAVLVPASAGLAWLSANWEFGAILLPGQLVGSATAYLLGAALVWRWERRNGATVLAPSDRHGEPTAYAGPPA